MLIDRMRKSRRPTGRYIGVDFAKGRAKSVGATWMFHRGELLRVTPLVEIVSRADQCE